MIKTHHLHHLRIFETPALLISTCIMVAGCASTPPTPVRIEVPVMVPCVGEVPPRPAYEYDTLPATAPDGEIVLALARDWLQSRAYQRKLEALVQGCR